ncbi:GtrA family protein [Hydrogenovibrio halophilus]|uniref:GtrA family protein n=1 Tax=Hydrogenovibrio halophilus TaxID=373391 RepID=UPI0012FD8638|nr:GtrA family protein [Hydrogenovibrio halophilus]
MKTHQQAMRFGVIGVFNTAVHSLVVVGGIETFYLNPVFANILGFFVANTGSFFLNCRYTFDHTPSVKSYQRFLSASSLSLALTIALSGLAEWMGWHYLVGLLLVIIFGPVLSFFIHKAWSFRL